MATPGDVDTPIDDFAGDTQGEIEKPEQVRGDAPPAPPGPGSALPVATLSIAVVQEERTIPAPRPLLVPVVVGRVEPQQEETPSNHITPTRRQEPPRQSGGRRQEPPRQSGGRRQEPPRQSRGLATRVCYCCLLLPIFLALGAMVVSVVTLTVKNEEVKRKCPAVQCILTCNDNPKVYLVDCWMVQGGGALVCLVLLLFLLSLVIRMCCGTKL